MIVRPEAEQDLLETIQWYEDQCVGLGIRFQREVEKVFGAIESTPELFGTVHRDTRRACTKRFPFAVYYRIEAREIVIQAIIHTQRNPQYWPSRLSE